MKRLPTGNNTVLAGALLLAGCAAEGAREAPPAADASVCSAEQGAFAVGATADADLAERVRAATGAGRVRLMEPDKAYTMEFDAARVNLITDRDRRITAVRCG